MIHNMAKQRKTKKQKIKSKTRSPKNKILHNKQNIKNIKSTKKEIVKEKTYDEILMVEPKFIKRDIIKSVIISIIFVTLIISIYFFS